MTTTATSMLPLSEDDRRHLDLALTRLLGQLKTVPRGKRPEEEDLRDLLYRVRNIRTSGMSNSVEGSVTGAVVQGRDIRISDVPGWS